MLLQMREALAGRCNKLYFSAWPLLELCFLHSRDESLGSKQKGSEANSGENYGSNDETNRRVGCNLGSNRDGSSSNTNC